MLKINKITKILSLVICITFMVTLFSACSSNKANTTQSQPAASGSSAPTSQSSTGGEKKTVKLKIGSGHIVENQWIKVMDNYWAVEVAKRVEQKTDYKIEWIKAYGGSIAKLGEVLEAVESGLLDVGYVVYVLEPTKTMLHGFTYRLPFQSTDPIMVKDATLMLYDKYPQFKKEFEKYNQKFVGVSVSDPYSMFSTVPVKGVADLKGKKVGAGGANLSWVENTGATPVQSNLNEAFTSMQTGVIQCNIQPTGAMYDLKVHEVAKYIVQPDFGSQAFGAIIVNKDLLNKVPKEVEQIMMEVGREYADKEAQYVVDRYNSDIQAMEKAGSTVIKLTPEEKAKWAAALPNKPAELVKELESKGYPGKDIVNDYFSFLKSKGFVMPREWDLSGK